MPETRNRAYSSDRDTTAAAAGTLGRRPLGAVPESAFLQAEDLGGVAPRPLTDDFGRHLRPPLPCGTSRYPSLLLRRAEGSILVDYPFENFHTTLLEHVTTYRGASAAAYMRELRVAVGRRGSCTDDTGRWTVEQAGVASPHSMLIRLHENFADPSGQPAEKDSYLIVARTARVVVVLADIGWEMGSGHEDTIRGLADAALRRAGTLR